MEQIPTEKSFCSHKRNRDTNSTQNDERSEQDLKDLTSSLKLKLDTEVSTYEENPADVTISDDDEEEPIAVHEVKNKAKMLKKKQWKMIIPSFFHDFSDSYIQKYENYTQVSQAFDNNEERNIYMIKSQDLLSNPSFFSISDNSFY